MFDDHTAKVGTDDRVGVAMAHGHTVAARDGGTLDYVAFGFGNRGHGEGAHVEEDDYFGAGTEFSDELCEHNGYHVSDFVEVDAYAVDCGNCSTSKGGCEFCFTGRTGGQ